MSTPWTAADDDESASRSLEPRFPVSVKAVLDAAGHVPLLHNDRDEWELPGGRLEAGEEPEMAVVREVKEELALDVEVGALIDAWTYRPRTEPRTVLSRVLLTERTDTGQWCLPGGSAEPGQTFADAAIAELREETGLVAAAEQLTAFASLSDERWTHFTFPNADEIHSFHLCFLLRDWEGAAAADGDESARVGFYARDARPDPMLPMSERVLELHDAWVCSGAFQAS